MCIHGNNDSKNMIDLLDYDTQLRKVVKDVSVMRCCECGTAPFLITGKIAACSILSNGSASVETKQPD